jgi:hypothetical protein
MINRENAVKTTFPFLSPKPTQAHWKGLKRLLRHRSNRSVNAQVALPFSPFLREKLSKPHPLKTMAFRQGIYVE